MHEMSIALNIIELATAAAEAEGAHAITAIEVEVGALAGVMADSLEFCFEAAARDSLAQGAKLLIHSTRPMGQCLDCGRKGEIAAFGDQCACGGFLASLGGGNELKIMSITVDE